MLRNTGAERYNLRANSDFKVGKYIKIGESVNISRMEYEEYPIMGKFLAITFSCLTADEGIQSLNKEGYARPQDTFEFERGIIPEYRWQ